MVIGIDSSRQQYVNTNFASKVNENCFYGLDSGGKLYKNDMDINTQCIICKKNYKFTQNETLKIQLVTFNVKTGMLIFRKEKDLDVICMIKGIDISKTYHFAVSMFHINDEI
eukprot:410560_1